MISRVSVLNPEEMCKWVGIDDFIENYRFRLKSIHLDEDYLIGVLA